MERESLRKPIGIGLKAYIGVVFLIIIAVIVSKTDAGPQEEEVKRRKRDAVGLCWKDQGLKSLAPDERRFIAGVCEAMDAEFVRDYGVSAN